MLRSCRAFRRISGSRKFSGISDKLAVQITAEFGDLSKFRNKKCLISFVGIDAPTYESGDFKGNRREISKRVMLFLERLAIRQ